MLGREQRFLDIRPSEWIFYRIQKYSVHSGGEALNGYVEADKEAYLGYHSINGPHKRIGNRAYVGKGSAVISIVNEGILAFGNHTRELDC